MALLPEGACCLLNDHCATSSVQLIRKRHRELYVTGTFYASIPDTKRCAITPPHIKLLMSSVWEQAPHFRPSSSTACVAKNTKSILPNSTATWRQVWVLAQIETDTFWVPQSSWHVDGLWEETSLSSVRNCRQPAKTKKWHELPPFTLYWRLEYNFQLIKQMRTGKLTLNLLGRHIV